MCVNGPKLRMSWLRKRWRRRRSRRMDKLPNKEKRRKEAKQSQSWAPPPSIVSVIHSLTHFALITALSLCYVFLKQKPPPSSLTDFWIEPRRGGRTPPPCPCTPTYTCIPSNDWAEFRFLYFSFFRLTYVQLTNCRHFLSLFIRFKNCRSF